MLPTRSVLAGAGLIAVASSGFAQCPDGTPPPCDTRRTVSVPVTRPQPPAATERAKRFLILPFRNVTQQATENWLVEGSTTMLVEALGRWQGVSVVADEKLYPALKRNAITPGAVADGDKVRRVAEETGGWTAVTGEVLATGGRLRLTARATDVMTSRELVRASSEVATGGDVRLAFDSLSLRLLRAAGFDSTTADFSQATTRNLDAYRAYLSGRAHMRRSEVKPALKDFQEAVRVDSTFALGWMNLAEASFVADPSAIINPTSVAGQYLSKAVALSTKLPPRDRQRVLATDAQYHAQFAEARRILEALFAQDSSDVEVLVGLAGLEMFDPVLVDVPGGKRPRGQPNRAARLGKRATELDPSRNSTFGTMANVYAAAGIPGSTPTLGIEGTPGSFSEFFQMVQQPGRRRVYQMVLGDSLMLFPVESVSVLFSKDSLKALQKRAREGAIGWTERWVSASGGEAAPHATLAELHALNHDYQRALKSLATAESLGGIQSPGWNGPTRRMMYQAKMGNYTAASRLADSLTAAGLFGSPAFILQNGDALGWAFALNLASNRMARVNTLFDATAAARRPFNGASAEQNALGTLLGNADPDDEPGIPRAFRGRELDTLLAHIDAVAASQLGPWLPLILPTIAEVADTTHKRLPGVLKAAETLAAGGHSQLAFQVASNAVATDSMLEAIAATYAWYKPGAEALNAAKRAAMDRFKPATATVAADRAVFEWTVIGDGPFARNRAETPLTRGEYRWEMTVNAGDRYYRLGAGAAARTAGPPVSATLAELLPPTASRYVVTGRLAGGVQKDTTGLQGVTPRTEFAAGVLRFIITDKSVIDQLRAAKPAEARFRFLPCVRPLGWTGKLECVEASVKISYP